MRNGEEKKNEGKLDLVPFKLVRNFSFYYFIVTHFITLSNMNFVFTIFILFTTNKTHVIIAATLKRTNAIAEEKK